MHRNGDDYSTLDGRGAACFRGKCRLWVRRVAVAKGNLRLYFRFSSKSDHKLTALVPTLCAQQLTLVLFDQLLGTDKQHWRDFEAECLGGPEVDN
jgi:hypothetical protein